MHPSVVSDLQEKGEKLDWSLSVEPEFRDSREASDEWSEVVVSATLVDLAEYLVVSCPRENNSLFLAPSRLGPNGDEIARGGDKGLLVLSCSGGT